MCDNNNSVLDEIIAYTLILTILYLTILAMPIIPYLDIILGFIYSIHKPDSILGGLFLGIVFYIIGYVMLEGAKFVAQKFFTDKGAMYLFLYGQGLILVGFLGEEATFPISTAIVKLVSAGFNEPTGIGKYYLIVPGVISMVLSYLFENSKRVATSKRS